MAGNVRDQTCVALGLRPYGIRADIRPRRTPPNRPGWSAGSGIGVSRYHAIGTAAGASFEAFDQGNAVLLQDQAGEAVADLGQLQIAWSQPGQFIDDPRAFRLNAATFEA